MLKLLKTIMRAGTATVKYPFAPLEVSPRLSRETGPDAQPMYCLRCLRLCLSGKCADYPDRRPAKFAHWQLYLGRCIYCGRCEEVCPTRAIQLTNNFELTVTNKADLYTRATFHLQRCSRCERPFAPQKPSHWLLNCWHSNKMRHKTAKCCGRKRASARSANNARR